jgi:8-oxo-dGTP diphosphatase
MTDSMKTVDATLCFFIKDQSVLLGVKMRGIGLGCWNGYGGRIEPGETPEEAIVREVFEEACVRIDQDDLKKYAVINFKNKKGSGYEVLVVVRVYCISRWQGDHRATEEIATPTWFSFDQVPFDQMMPGDGDWLPMVLAGKCIRAEIEHYEETGVVIIRMIEEVSQASS